ncbi:MAG: hypothetical protein WBM02_10395 [bacterium]
MMDIWNRGPLTENPYYRTAFRVARVPPEETRHRVMVSLINQTRKVVRENPCGHMIGMDPVTEPEINAAEKILVDPKQRILEEMLVHKTERLRLDQLKKLLKDIDEIVSNECRQPSRLSNVDGLQFILNDLIKLYLSVSPVPDPSFGALEMDLIPPFGIDEED